MESAPLYDPQPSCAPPTFDGLSLQDLANLLDADGGLDAAARSRLADLVRADPRCAPRLAELERLAADAGLGQELESALWLNRCFDRLLAAGAWKDPDEVLDVDDPQELHTRVLLRIADARAGRASDPSAIVRVKERLLAAEVRAAEEPLKRFVLCLTALSPEGAERILELARQLLEYSREVAGPQ